MGVDSNQLGELTGKGRVLLAIAATIALTAMMAISLVSCGQASQTSTSDSATSASVSSAATSEVAPIPDGAIEWSEALSHIGETASVYGPVKGSSYLPETEGQHTYIDLGAEYPDEHRASMDILGKNRGNFTGDPENLYLGKTVCVTGEIYEHDGVAYIKVTSADQVKVLD